MMLVSLMAGTLHLALLDGGQTNLVSNIDNNYPAQTTLPVGEGGLSRVRCQGGATPRWFTFQLALLLQPTRPIVRLNHAVGVR